MVCGINCGHWIVSWRWCIGMPTVICSPTALNPGQWLMSLGQWNVQTTLDPWIGHCSVHLKGRCSDLGSLHFLRFDYHHIPCFSSSQSRYTVVLCCHWTQGFCSAFVGAAGGRGSARLPSQCLAPPAFETPNILNLQCCLMCTGPHGWDPINPLLTTDERLATPLSVHVMHWDPMLTRQNVFWNFVLHHVFVFVCSCSNCHIAFFKYISTCLRI